MLTDNKYPKRTLIYDYSVKYGYAREPVFRRMPDGSFICVSLSGGPFEPQNNNVVLVTRSRDDGDTWSEPEVLFSHSARGCWSTEIFTAGEAPMLVVQTYNCETNYREIQTFRSYTSDSGKTWTLPKSFPCGVDNISVRQGIVLSNGDWLFPVYWQETFKGGFDWNVPGTSYTARCGVAVSRDKGETYARFGYLYNKNDPESEYWEPNAVELEYGHILMLMRSDKNFSYSESFDYGRTWSDTGIYPLTVNSDTKFSLIKVGAKVVLLNNFITQGRTRLEMWVSDDNCKSWDKKLPLCPPDERMFYPHGYADDEKQILYIAYENARQHYFVKIPYSEL